MGALPILPAWCDNPAGRDLIARIVAEQPDYTITRGGWLEGGGQRHYRGRTAQALRVMRDQLAEELLSVADDHFRAGEAWDECGAEANAVLASETADALIARLCPDEALVWIGVEPARHVLTDRIVKRRAA